MLDIVAASASKKTSLKRHWPSFNFHSISKSVSQSSWCPVARKTFTNDRHWLWSWALCPEVLKERWFPFSSLSIVLLQVSFDNYDFSWCPIKDCFGKCWKWHSIHMPSYIHCLFYFKCYELCTGCSQQVFFADNIGSEDSSDATERFCLKNVRLVGDRDPDLPQFSAI